MNSFLNPLMNPDLGEFRDPELDTDIDEHISKLWTDENLIDALTHLIQVCRDGQEGYLQAAQHVKSAWLEGLFQNFTAQREQFAIELTNLVAGLGAEADTGTTITGVLHRTWLDLRSTLTGKADEDAAILDECERGEDAAKEAYETELNKELPEHIHRVVQSQYQAILRSHDQVREARDAFPR